MSTTFPKALIIDFDGICRVNSRNPASPFYRIIHPHMSVVKPGVKEAFEIIFALNIPFYIATKQRAFSDGTLTQENFEAMWVDFKERVVPLKFQHLGVPQGLFDQSLLVEPAAKDKTALFKLVLEKHPELKPDEIWVIDDSYEEIDAARSLGLSTQWTTHLYRTIIGQFNLQ